MRTSAAKFMEQVSDDTEIQNQVCLTSKFMVISLYQRKNQNKDQVRIKTEPIW